MLTLLAAVAFAYHAHRLRRYERQQRAENTIRSIGGGVHISRRPPVWWQRLAGPAHTTCGKTQVVFCEGWGPELGDAKLAVLAKHLPNLPQGKRLVLGQAFRDGTESRIWLWTDPLPNHAEYLRNQPPWVDTEITDRGLAHLSRLTDLEGLVIQGSRITDKGLEYLRKLTNLKHLWLVNTSVSQHGVQRLRAALPNCEIAAMQREDDERLD